VPNSHFALLLFLFGVLAASFVLPDLIRLVA
jgi:hypothetical protein